MTMARDECQFLALKILVESARSDPDNLGFYMSKAYRLGEGKVSIDDILKPPEPWKYRVGLELYAGPSFEDA